jgi:hypothetical protein
MGGGRFDPGTWTNYSTTTRSYASKTVDEIYADRLDESVDPKKIKLRESRDSDVNPNSTPVIVGLDVTGSMMPVLDAMARQGLKTLMTEIYDRKPVTDPHLMYMAIGDAETDRAPLQATQFEAETIALTQALEKLWLEQGGGGNMYEGYSLAWLFAAMRTSHDAFEKRGRKGYLFTVGDELPTPVLTKGDILRHTGIEVEADLEPKQLLTLVSRQWEIFHLIVEEGTNYTDRVEPAWRKLLGQHAIPLEDHRKMGEVIVSTMQVREGADADKVAGSWDGKTSIVVAKAIKDITPAAKTGGIKVL